MDILKVVICCIFVLGYVKIQGAHFVPSTLYLYLGECCATQVFTQFNQEQYISRNLSDLYLSISISIFVTLLPHYIYLTDIITSYYSDLDFTIQNI